VTAYNETVRTVPVTAAVTVNIINRELARSIPITAFAAVTVKTNNKELARPIAITATVIVRVPQPNTLKRWDGAAWVPIFSNASYLSIAGGYLTGDLRLRNAALIGTNAIGDTEWGRVSFSATTTTVGATGASKVVALATNSTTRFSVADTVVTSTLPIGLPAQATSGMTAVNAATRKDYVDGLVSPLLSASTAASTYLNKTSAGDAIAGVVTVNTPGALTMAGSVLTLRSAMPTATYEAAPKTYVDQEVAAANAATALKLPLAGGTLTGLVTSNMGSAERFRFTGFTSSFISGWSATGTPVQIGALNFIEGAGGAVPHFVRLTAATGNVLHLRQGSVDRFTITDIGLVTFPSVAQTHHCGQVRIGVTGNALALTTSDGADTNVYMSFYRGASSPPADPLPTRSGLVGFLTAGGDALYLQNEVSGGNVVIDAAGVGIVNITSDTTVTGQLTITDTPPTANNHAARKDYVDTFAPANTTITPAANFTINGAFNNGVRRIGGTGGVALLEFAITRNTAGSPGSAAIPATIASISSLRPALTTRGWCVSNNVANVIQVSAAGTIQVLTGAAIAESQAVFVSIIYQV
jgi:hypothetical protein